MAFISGQFAIYGLTLAIIAWVLPGVFRVFHLANGVRSLEALVARMRESGSNPWLKVKPYSRSDLIEKFGLFQYNVPHNQNWDLFLIKKCGSAEMNHYCYINTLSNVYIETVNADADLKSLPVAQKYLIYHEIAHASFLGSEYWVARRAELIFVPITLAALVIFVHEDTSPLFFVPVTLLAIAVIGSSTRLYRNTTSEQVADRQALRWICQEDPEQAIRIAQMKIRRWDESLESNANMSGEYRLLTIERRRAMEQLLGTIRDWQDGKRTIDPDRIPWPLRHPFHFLFAVTSLLLIIFWGGAPSPEQTAALSWLVGVSSFLMLLVGAAYQVKQTRLDEYIQARFKEVNANDDIS